MKLIILDRDGVINFESTEYIKCAEEWNPIPGSLQAIAELNRKGYIVVVATNQAGIGRGLFNEMDLFGVHEKMQLALKAFHGQIDHIFYCPHAPSVGCNCRKPAPGLLKQIAAYYHCDLANVPFVGDSMRDIHAACAVGCQPILVRSGNGIATEPLLIDIPQAIPVYDDLASYVTSL